MANYTGPQDVNKDAYEKMSDSYHEDAKEYIDNMLIRSAGYDPDDLLSFTTTVPYIIKQLSLTYAMEQYALSRTRSPGDYWDQQYQAMQGTRISYERRFNPTVFYTNTEETDQGRQGGASARIYRV